MANRQKIFDMTNGKCIYCGCDLDFENFHIDHLVPKSKGGKDKDNMFPACPDCNLSKGSLSVEEFRQKLGLLLRGTHTGRMIEKYYGAEEQDIKFWFEYMQWYELDDMLDLQKRIYDILERSEDLSQREECSQRK